MNANTIIEDKKSAQTSQGQNEQVETINCRTCNNVRAITYGTITFRNIETHSLIAFRGFCHKPQKLLHKSQLKSRNSDNLWVDKEKTALRHDVYVISLECYTNSFAEIYEKKNIHEHKL